MFAERFRNRLLIQKEAGLFRNPPEIGAREGKHLIIGNSRMLNFASNDYLGLGSSEDLRKCAARNFGRYGTSSSSSRLVSGHYETISRAEKAYAAYFGYGDALFFPSGYQANLAVLSTFFEPGDRILFDKHIHASSVKGMALSRADFLGYNHNDLGHLERRLQGAADGPLAVLTESLFSMDGDLLDAGRLRQLKDRSGFLTIVDEAHAFGALGDGGRGLAGGVADIAVGTFGKAFGLFGAFVLLPEEFKEYLFNFSSPLIYTTTLPEAHAAAALDALAIVAGSGNKRRHLAEVSACLKERLRREGFRVSGDAHILALEIGDEARALGLSRHLRDRGIFVLPARYPTVPLNRAILRVGVTALHEEEDVLLFVNGLKESYGKLD